MKLKTFLIVGCLGGFFALNSCTAPTNEKDYSVFMKTLPLTDSHTRTSVAQDVVTTATYYSCRLSANSDIRPLIRKVSN